MPMIAIVYHSETGNTAKMAQLVEEGCKQVPGVDVKAMSISEVDGDLFNAAQAAIIGSPTYEGTMSWQMKQWLDTPGLDFTGKLGGCFCSQNWPGGGGADLAEITIIAAMLVRGMMVYSGGITQGAPYLHFGAVSCRSPEGLYAERCIKLGRNIAAKTIEVFAS